MRIIQGRNVHDILPRALQLLDQEGVRRDSRNGPVLLGPSVTTVYERPQERVLFHPSRDANPFFHLYECLWMLAGRSDVTGPARYASNMRNYSDDGDTLNGAYGHRWRRAFLVPNIGSRDQLVSIARRLKENPDDRRCVLQMWSTTLDLDNASKDVCCNLTATFQRGLRGELDLTVFCRSNDIVLGCYGANAVHFSFLLEYMALWIGCLVGTYTQISVNWHGYLDTLTKVKDIRPDKAGYVDNPYAGRRVIAVPLSSPIERMDATIHDLLHYADSNNFTEKYVESYSTPWALMAARMLYAHQLYRAKQFDLALNALGTEWTADWLVAGREWLRRRQAARESK